ncbi:diacylglycerol acyltransferase [Chlamydoabsidia padenii]|nr:diacylglycerol acyltransferase [Chlamydoabsidia padenii]
MAPLSRPLKRRLEMVSVILWHCSSFFLFALFLYNWTRLYLLPLALVYLIHMVMDRSAERGGRPFQWVREWSLWKHMSDYFPINIIKEQDLDPNDNYLFGYHPHGIFCFGAVSIFNTEGSEFSQLFPGVKVRLATVSTLFLVPFYRDLILSMGFCSASRSSCEYVLKSGPGKSLGIVVGGANEALASSPGYTRLILKKRLGFIRLAIRQRASLVPVFAFGEGDLYKQHKVNNGSFVDKLRTLFKNTFGISFPLFYGRGIFHYDFGLIPYRRQLTIIVGKPIPVPKMDNGQSEPTQEQLQDVQGQYIEALTGIYNKYKDIYAKDRQQDLEIIA